MKTRAALWFWFTFFVVMVHFRRSLQQSPTNSTRRLSKAYIALREWRHRITADPNGFTSNWHGPNVCNYTGVYCTAALDDSNTITVAGIDLNHANISGTLPQHIALLTDLALFHINSNRFSGGLPAGFSHLKLLHELDVSNNLLSGSFPTVILSLPSLRFLDLRFNQFHGAIPDELFSIQLDALFINNNNFNSSLPINMENSTLSVLVLANNNFTGCIPRSITKIGGSLNEIVLMNSGLTGCLPSDLGSLKDVTVFDVSNNKLAGQLPRSMAKMTKLEQVNLDRNEFSGAIPHGLCSLPNLQNFTYSYNYFISEPIACMQIEDVDDLKNCIPNRPKQRSQKNCTSFFSHPVDCSVFGCSPAGILPTPIL